LTEHDDLPAAARTRRLEERLIAAGLTSDEEIDEFLTRLYSSASPGNGARMVARAWTDPQYRDLLLSDGNAAAAQAGFDGLSYQLRVVANTGQTHNVIVCTLCSCYPVSLLGPSPGWYKSFPYRSRTVREPRAVLAEFGVTCPAASRSRSGTRPRRPGTWCCRCARPGPRRWTPGSWPPW